ncbi:GNAT family N-acetyltransferase [Pseudovibrio sp. Alg231-02]|uniref:GNAT family N-acetyltransferase n=1 Tax=Pseudovibrio sp. Alg231-02 TaxID=1922223 RepID=UPI001AD8CB42|nr:GNAT family N-acetyltransferase [Pseudovibrio sp. Alg231-02]
MHCQMRLAAKSQAIALTDIMHAAKGHWGYDPQDMQEFRDHWKITAEMIEADPILVITDHERPLGFARITRENAETALLDCLFVLPEAHGKGHGAWLLEGAEEAAKRMQCTRMRLESDANAAPFYQHHGYHSTSNRPSAFKGAGPIEHMQKDLTPQIHEIADVSLNLNTSDCWDFATNNSEAIKENWQTLISDNPDLWDGKVLSLYQYSLDQKQFSGDLVEINYSEFLAWRDWGFPDRSAKNLFGCAVLRSSQGHLVFGKMAGNTATAGQVYPPGGNLDLNDITPSGKVDIFGSIARELEEETGLTLDQGELGDVFAIEDGPRLAIARILTLQLTSDEILSKIAHFNANQKKPELEEAVIVKSREDLKDYSVPPYALALTAHLLN